MNERENFDAGETLSLVGQNEKPGVIIAGRFKLLEPIGEGGMGSVWLAEQAAPVKRKVAIKLIKSGMDSKSVLARFDAERQALAMMDHPNIAKVYDGGVTEQGRPYFVMEYVKGIPLTLYCDQVRLSLPDRLTLFASVCQAVQHAHQKGIIHRDLKPSNILACLYDGQPVPKVIDFGLAKAMHQSLTDQSLHTALGTMVGTPLYMSPEQAEHNNLDVDTRTDIYSLGVILYELLTGTTPLEKQQLKAAAYNEILRLIKDVEPPKPSTRLSGSDSLPSVAAQRNIDPNQLRKALSGDLDWIVMKALDKERSRRYETANGLALDVQRYLSGEAVLAAPPSQAYRLRKFVRRNRAPVIAASLLLLTLLAGMIGTSYGLYRANESAKLEGAAKIDAQEKRAEAELQRTRAEERERQAIDAVNQFGAAVANNDELKNNPALESLRKTLLNEPLSFFKSLRERLQADKDTRPESLARLASAAFGLGKLSDEIGDKQDAIKSYEQSIAILTPLVDTNPTVTEFQSDLAKCHHNIGSLLSETGKPGEALVAYEKSREIRERLVEANPTVTKFQNDLAASHNNIGTLLSETGKPGEALAAFERAREIRERLVAANPTVTDFQSGLAMSHNNIGVQLRLTGKPGEALAAYEKAREIRERLVEANPTVTKFQNDLATSHHNIGSLLKETGKPGEALAACEKAREIRERLMAANPTDTDFQSDLAESHYSVGNLLHETGKSGEALAAYEKAREIRERLVAANPTVTQFQSGLGATLNNLAMIEMDVGQFAKGRDYLRKAVEWQKKALAGNPANPTYRRFLENHFNSLARAADGLFDQELRAEAERGLAELSASDPQFAALDRRMEELLGGQQAKDPAELLTLGQRAYDLGRFALAARWFGEALERDAAPAVDRRMQHAYNAACCAALAGCGQGLDDSPPDEAAREKLRGQALTWLDAELDRWTKDLESATAEIRVVVARTLKHWQTDKDLAGIREAAEMAKLPESERTAFDALWKRVNELVAQATSVAR